jgi:probable HAF family extracellular repeat protein
MNQSTWKSAPKVARRLLVTLAVAIPLGAQIQPPRYIVTDLGPVNNPFSQATGINIFGLISGFDTAADGTSHAFIAYEGMITDISKPGLGGPNSSAGGVNDFAEVVGGAETSSPDPNNENFCAYGTGLQCVPFVWRYGVMTQLTTLGGTNAGFGMINNRGQVAGYAENSTIDKTCRPGVQVNGTGPQVLDFEAVIWGPRPGEIRQLQPLSGDTVAIAIWVNDNGQAVGTSGTCANTLIPGFTAGPHAVLWESDGTVVNLGSLGGTVNTDILGVGTFGGAINNFSEVTGQATLAGNTTFHPFRWTRETGMQDLGVLSGDLVGAGLGMNNLGDIVGASVSAPGPATGNPRAFLWQNGVMSDLNTLAPGSPLYLLTAFGINEFEEVVGFGVQTDSGDLHAFLAQPCDAGSTTASCQVSDDFADANRDPENKKPVVLSETARKQLLRWGLRGH